MGILNENRISSPAEEEDPRTKVVQEAQKLVKKLRVLKTGDNELELNLVFCWWSQAEAAELFEQFHQCLQKEETRPVTSVKVSHEFGVEAIKALLMPLRSSLKTLYLNGLKDDDLEGLQETILNCTCLQALTLESCHFLSAASIPTLTKVVDGLPKLQSLSLNDNQELFHNTDLKDVMPFALALFPLRHVELRRCRLAGEAADVVMDVLTASKTLVNLTIVTEIFHGESRNKWNDAWTKTLLDNRKLQKVHIDTCADLDPPRDILTAHCERNKGGVVKRHVRAIETQQVKEKKCGTMEIVTPAVVSHVSGQGEEEKKCDSTEIVAPAASHDKGKLPVPEQHSEDDKWFPSGIIPQLTCFCTS